MYKILVIEDEAELREEIAEWLSLEGFETIEAPNGVDGINRALETLPDVVVCDIAMPELDGYGVLYELQSNPATLDIPFIFITARASRDDMRYGMSLGADDYLAKPFSRSELLQSIQSRLKKKSMLEQRRIQQDKMLVQALQQEKERNLVRTRMVAMVTHDFRTPLTVIASCNSLLRDYAEGLTQERRILQQNRIEASVRKLLYMLDDMMIVAQSENGTLPFDPSAFTPAELVNAMVEEFQFIYAESHRINFENSYGGSVYADNNLVRHITANLISNAVKYSPKGSTINVTLSLSPDDENHWILQVQDFGIGISEADQTKLFTPFYRAENVGKIKGTGLGLMIVKQAVEKHGGSIQVESKLNEGSTFTVTIPLISQGEPTAIASDL